MKFNSPPRVIGHVDDELATLAQVKSEPMFFHADTSAAWVLGGSLTRRFLDFLDLADEWLIDSRVHMLMPGWYPCIPGWHHDDVPRNTASGQPNYDEATRPYHSEHVCMVVDAGTGSLTEFLAQEVVVEEPADTIERGQTVYGVWNAQIQEIGRPRSVRIRSGDVVAFTADSFHRGMPATGSGWRFFIRATRHTETKPLNELRTQVQVYLPAPEAGW